MCISADGCTLVDESDGTVVDDDDVLVELKDKTFILLASTEEWIPSTSHQPKPIDIDAATQGWDTKTTTEYDVSPQEPSCNTTTAVVYFEFMNELQLTNRCDVEHLTTVARSLASLNITCEQWSFLWTNQTFLDFVDNCARHAPAKMLVVTLFRNNETAQKMAPVNVLAKFNITHSGLATDVSILRQLTKKEFKNKNRNISDRVPQTIDMEVEDDSGVDESSRPVCDNNVPETPGMEGEDDSSVEEESRPVCDNALRSHNIPKNGAVAQFNATSLLGGKTFNITQTEYYTIGTIIPMPEVNETELEGFIGKVLPYVLQRVKMRGCCVLQPSRFSALVHSQEVSTEMLSQSDPFSTNNTRGEVVTEQYACPVSRLDSLTCLLGSVANIVARDLLLVMSQFPVAFPLIMRNVAGEGNYTLMTPLLRGIVVKWEAGSGKIIEHSLFNDPFKLLVAVRLGQNNIGKSAILNQMLAKEHTFSTKSEPGSRYGKPATVDGSVEFIWLTQETCKDTLWKPFICQHYTRDENTIILLANLHGDANENKDIIASLSHCFQCRYLAFIMPSCDENQWKNFLSLIPSKDHVSTICVDPVNYNINEPRHIQTSCITEDTTIHKVRRCLDNALKGCSSVQNVSSFKRCSRVSAVDGIDTKLSKKIVDFVSQNTCKSTKGCLPLQARSSSEQNSRRRNTTIHDVVRYFIRILQSPPDIAQRALIHLETEISRLCSAETQEMRLLLSKLKNHLKKAMVNLDKNRNDIEHIRKKVADTQNVIDNMNLGLEHFFREVGDLYKLELLREGGSNTDVLMLPSKVADLFLNGHYVELLDGDSGQIRMHWLNAIFKHVHEKHPKLRVYVISIIGLQSSGKSTLLNSLFACRFAVSVGRCSRGLFMRLLFLDKEVAKHCKVDAVLLIDSEGLGSPEKMGDVEAEKKDRLLTTFAMGISNLAIINVLGEYMKEMTEILQIAVVTMTRLEKADIAPDLLMVQHLQTEKNYDKLSQIEEQFCQAIRNAIDLAEKKDVQVGARNAKCIGEIFARLQNRTLLKQFHPYKDGATANAPASEGYHNDVVSLYENIVACCKSSKTVIEFKNWKTLLESYWDCVTQEDFALRFKNIKEIHDFIDRGQRIAQVKQAIDAAFSAHAREHKSRIALEVHDENSSQNREHFVEKLENHINRLPHECTAAATEKCLECKEAFERQKSLYEYVQGQAYEIETQTTISKYIADVRQSTIRKLSQSFDAAVMQQGCCVVFDYIINAHLKRHLSQGAAGEFPESVRKRITDEIFVELSQVARANDDDVPVRDRIKDALRYEYRAHPDIIDLFNAEIKSFENIFAENRNFLVAGILKVKNFGGENQRANEIEYLKSTIDSLLRRMLEQRKADCYEYGMVGELMHKLTDELDKIVKHKLKLTLKQKLDVHVWTLQQFCKRMEVMQAEWDRKNKPSSILNDNKDRYIQIINTRLRHGFTCAAEGQIIGQHLLKVIQQKAIDAENLQKIRDVEGLVWTTNSEKVRLKYFKYLADQVAKSKKDATLAYFLNPTEQIDAWYKKTVDDYRSESFGKMFTSTFENEFASVLRSVRNAGDSAELVSITQEYSAGMEALYYQPSSTFSDSVNPDELEVIKLEIVDTMENNKDQFSHFDDKLFAHPSADAGVMARLGCTARCFWCGALCWGQRGHEADQGETRKHHSSHQPQGLLGTHYILTHHLSAQPCHDMTADTMVHFGDYMVSGIRWQVAKEQHFSDWKFDRHYNSRFDELMRWFFSELHHNIATAQSRKPATVEDLKRCNCTSLNYDDIMSRIEQEIN